MRLARPSVFMILLVLAAVLAAPVLALTACEFCGALNAADAERCTVCGKAVGKAAAPPSARPSPRASPESVRRSPPADIPPLVNAKALPADPASPTATPVITTAASAVAASVAPAPSPRPSVAVTRPSPSPEPESETEPEPKESAEPEPKESTEPEPKESAEPEPKESTEPEPKASTENVRVGTEDLPTTGSGGATLVIDSKPQGAEVRIRGRVIGRTPLKRAMPGGFYRVTLAKPGFDTARLRLRMRSGQTLHESVELEEDTSPADTIAIEDPPLPAKALKHLGHEQATEPAPSPTAPIEFSDPPPPPRSGAGTFAIELVHYGEQTLASSFAVEIDGSAAGRGHMVASELSARMVHTLRYQRSLNAGPHKVKLTLLGVPTIKGQGLLQEANREFDIMVSASRNTTLYHTWAGGIEEFSKPHACCDRGHKK